jgi:hypothetical protein
VAHLRIADRDGYGKLAGNVLNGRAVKLKHRPLGSDGEWSTEWLDPLSGSGAYELTLAPAKSREYKAAFPAPDDEGLRASWSDVLVVRVKGE